MGDRIVRMGDIETREKIYGPSSDRVEAWWAEYRDTPGLSDFEVVLVGNFAEAVFGISTLPTIDVDVILMGGDIKNEKLLKSLLDEAARIGFKYNLLIDIFYNNTKFDIKKPAPYVAYRSWAVWFTQSTNGQQHTYTHEGPDVEVLPSGLVRYTRNKELKSLVKANKRYLNGDYIGVQMNVKDGFDEHGKLKGKVIPNSRESAKYKAWMASDARKEKLKLKNQ